MNIQNSLESLIPWFLSSGIKIIVILIVAILVDKIGRKFIDKAIVRAIKDTTKEGTKKRQQTIFRIFSGTLKIIIWLVVLMMVLPEFGINVGPILAGAGILGVALGFGAQWIVRDFLAGLFIILENQYRVGDVVCFDGTCGLVEDINLRKTILRDLDGTVHHIPNGEIKKTSNLSKGFSRVNLNVGVAYKENLDKVTKVLNKVGEDLAKDPQWIDSIIKAPQVLGVDDFADSAVIIKVLGDTKPLKQWDVSRELRKRIKAAFDKEGIEIPFPQMSVWPKGQWQK